MGTMKKGVVCPHVLMGDIFHGNENLPIFVVYEVDEEASSCRYVDDVEDWLYSPPAGEDGRAGEW